jgi:putative hemolysin
MKLFLTAASAASFILIVSIALLGCPSKDNTSSSGATSPSGSSASGGGGGGSGPLAGLEASPFQNEAWTAQEGGPPQPFVFWARENVRASAGCRSAAGQINCDALRFLRSGVPVEVPKRSLTGSVSAGTRACTKLGHQLWSGRSNTGSEDGFCRFPDGSMISTGALEQYGMRIVE